MDRCESDMLNLYFCFLLHLRYFCWLPAMLVQSNPIARWHICQGSINSIAFSTDGAYLATVGRDGIMSIRCCLHCVITLFANIWAKFNYGMQVIYVFLTTQKSNLYVVAKVTMVLSYVVLGGSHLLVVFYWSLLLVFVIFF